MKIALQFALYPTDEEASKIDKAWRQDMTVRSRAEYLRKAVNYYTDYVAGKESVKV